MMSAMRFFKCYALSLISFGLLSACTSIQQEAKVEEPKNGLETIAVLGTNDIHGRLAPVQLKTRENPGVQSIEYEAGGAPIIASFVNILKGEFGSRFVWLDAGDEFQGSIESNTTLGAPMVDFFNSSGLHAAAVGNHEFDFGLDPLKERMKDAKYPFLAANIRDRITMSPPDFPNFYAHYLMKAGSLKIGVIGLTTVTTPIKTVAENVKNLTFENLTSATIRGAQTLRKMGANVILVTAHVGLECDRSKSSRNRLMKKFSDRQGFCQESDEMVQLLNSLPPDTVDAVVAGHSHQIIHHWIAGVPVIQAGAFGRYLNVVYLTYDWEKRKILPEQTRIEGPIPVCTKVFQNQNDCNGDRPSPENGRGPLVPYVFHNQVVQPDPKTVSAIAPVLKKSEAIQSRILGQALLPIEHPAFSESEMGNLFADAIRGVAQTDFAMVNSGGIRSALEKGNITYGDIFRAFPFDNHVAILKVTGKQLTQILQVAQNDSKGFVSVSGLKMKVIDHSVEAPYEDYDKTGLTAAWKYNRLLSLTKTDGQALNPDQVYTLATIDFLVFGGDGMGWPMSQISKNQIQISTGILAREAVMKWIEKNSPLNSKQYRLLDPSSPRLALEKPVVKFLVEKQDKRKNRGKKKVL